MTAQTPEILIYEGEELNMTSNPSLNDMADRGWGLSTGNYRGYVGVWEIKDNKLYLNEVRGGFKKEELPAFADWISEELHAWKGNMLHYVHAGYGSMYEEDVFFKIESGILNGIRSENNIDKFCDLASESVRSADTKQRIQYLYGAYLDPRGELARLIDKSKGDKRDRYVALKNDLEFDFKQRLIAMAEDPNSGITLVYK